MFFITEAKFQRIIRIPKMYADNFKNRPPTYVRGRFYPKNLFDFCKKSNKFSRNMRLSSALLQQECCLQHGSHHNGRALCWAIPRQAQTKQSTKIQAPTNKPTVEEQLTSLKEELIAQKAVFEEFSISTVKIVHEYREEVVKLRELIATLPPYVRTFFRGIEPNTSSRTRIAYAYDLHVFFQFLKKENPMFKENKRLLSKWKKAAA